MWRGALLLMALVSCGAPEEDARARLHHALESYRLDRPEALEELVSITFEHPELKFDDGQWTSDVALNLALDLYNLHEDWPGMVALLKRVDAHPVLGPRAAAQRQRDRELQ